MSIFVIDGHPLMREALGALIRRTSEAAKVLEFDNAAEALEVRAEHGVPELICVEWSLNGSADTSQLAKFKIQWPDAPIMVVTAVAGQDIEALAMNAGASAFIHKSASSAAVANVLRGFLAPDTEVLSTEKLSKRQKQLLHLLDKGMSNRDIAESLQISEHTVKVHLWRLFRRLNVKSRSQASHLARTQGLL